jgi:hypothetical protein
MAIIGNLVMEEILMAVASPHVLDHRRDTEWEGHDGLS